MPVMTLEVPFDQVVRVIDQFTQEQKKYIREKLTPINSDWVRRFYMLFEDVRKQTMKFKEEEINRDIENAIKEVREKKRKRG